jgi:mannose-6-phosphate isomerase-like protein (cupin superfamily)
MTLSTDQAQVSATYHAAADVPTLAVGATTARLVATGDATGGQYGLFRWEMSKAPGGATPHVHRTFSEAFYVLDGRVSVYDGAAWRDAGPGDFLFVPPQGIHGFRNESGAPATMLILFAPGPPRERYFQELAERIASGRQFSDEDRRAFMARHDQYEVGE